MVRDHFVRSWMTANIISVSSETTVLEALFLLRKHSYRFLPVTSGSKIIGVITDRDLRNPVQSLHDLDIAKMYRTEGDIRMKDILCKDLVTITPQEHIAVAANLMATHKIHGLPVVAKSKSSDLVGIVTATDILKAFVELVDITNY